MGNHAVSCHNFVYYRSLFGRCGTSSGRFSLFYELRFGTGVSTTVPISRLGNTGLLVGYPSNHATAHIRDV